MIDLKQHIRDIPDFPKAGILFRDITPLLADAAAYAEVIRRLTEAAPLDVTRVAAIEARGFLFAPAVAAALSAGLTPIRKPGKLPRRTLSAGYALEYGTGTLEMHADAVGAGDRVYLLDDLIATGGSLAAAAGLIERAGAEVCKIACVIELSALNGRRQLPPAAPMVSLMQY